MSKKVNKQRKTRERGLNVKITEGTKKSQKSSSVRVNNNFGKKTTKKTSKKTSNEKTPKKVGEQSTENVEVRLPASFSRNSADAFSDVKWADSEPPKAPEVPTTPESPTTPEDTPINVLNTPHEAASFSETLRIDTSATSQYDSKIILRDVEKVSVEPEEKHEPETVLPSQTVGTDFNIGTTEQSFRGIGLSTEIETLNPVKAVKPVEKSPKKSANKEKPATAKELKESEIRKAVQSAAKFPASRNKRKRFSIQKIGWPRMILAVSCVATAIFAVAYFISLSASDMSIKVAAIQSGIEASYPSYIPRGYSLADVTSASGKVVMRFKCDESEYVLSEENSTWDANALLTNFVKYEYGDDYTVVKEQGLTLYMGDRWETWVNGGKLFKLSVTSGSLTKKQLKTIATSL